MRLLKKFFIKTSDVSVKNKQRLAKFYDKNKQRLSNDLKISKIVKGLLIYGVAYKTEKVYDLRVVPYDLMANYRNVCFRRREIMLKNRQGKVE